MAETKDLLENYSLEGVIDRFEDKMAVIITKDGQKLLWPIKNLPDDVEIGRMVRIVLSTDKTQVEEREKIAKTILNKILKNK
ncbi:MAG: hypothetical protein A2731_00655 [Candidatus Buchananbacteria bacterium RIFCSPHIGHO2_01_FULL_39_8]|uniref:DUF3006 domain-containing protein n=1 Tax=Candidatus Buchananbacteria bacterium RIFCSPHIGHO2_01_FULL_39_8 TaxID=1797533 RepID=A0A1G1XTD8_9BACT|nr:MAG: hypothetical protein A2731_00655 [Candidatus Buchananbacteria bacterium RIFCSPHIGHO2_01_FULL_39_8]